MTRPPHSPFSASTTLSASGSPIDRPGDDAELAAGRVDQQAGRQAERLAGGAQSLQRVAAGVGVARQRLDAEAVEEGGAALQPRRVDVDRHDLEVLSPAVACRRSSAGVSARQGAHQVAHRLRSSARPRKSASVSLRPSGARNAIGAAGRGAPSTASAARSPSASDARRGAPRPKRPGNRPRPCRAPALSRIAPPPPRGRPARRRRRPPPSAGPVGVLPHRSIQDFHHEQRHVGRTFRRRPRGDHGGDQRLHRLRPQAGRPGHRRLAGARRHAGAAGHHRAGRRRGHRRRA